MRAHFFPLTTSRPTNVFGDFENDWKEFFFDTKSGDEENWVSNIFENEKAYLFSRDLPGVKTEDLKISIEEDKILINTQRQIGFGNKAQKKETNQRILIPRNVDKENIKAHYEDGVLTLALYKLEKAKAKNIEITHGERRPEWVIN